MSVPPHPPELLAPAGNLEVAVAAFDAGADAVYCGLGRFNARERAENFTPDSLGQLLEFAHGHGRKVYLTCNTLVKEQELSGLGAMLTSLAGLKPDALIVQDPGVIRLVRMYFPELTLHASTQMGIHNSAGVRTAARMGCTRVILERQITLEELRRIAAESPLELEVFIHGSLCCSLSGRCLFSAALGSGSGNRGQCKQPCRREFRRSDGRSGCWFSPCDLNAMELIPEFRRLGIASLKIEGRLRGPDYVWKCVRAYRLLLDAPDRDPQAEREAKQLLRAAGGREAGLALYAGAEPRVPLIRAEHPGAFGTPVAVVEKLLPGGILVTSKNRMHLGDRLRFGSGGDAASFSLVRLEFNRQPVASVTARTRCFIAGDFHTVPGAELLKIGENGFDFAHRAATLPAMRYPLTLKLSCSAANWSAAIAEFPDFRWEKRTDFGSAERHPLTREAVAAVFGSGAEAPWRIGSLEVRLDGDFFVPASVLKELRRDFWQSAAPALSVAACLRPVAAAGERLLADLAARSGGSGEGVAMISAPGDALELPAFLAEAELPVLRRKLREAWERGVRRFIVSSWYGFELLRDFPGAEILVRFPLPVTNHPGADLVRDLGAAAVEAAPELGRDDVTALRRASALPLLEFRDALPVLVSRFPLGENCELADPHGVRFRLRFDSGEKLWKLYDAGDLRARFRSGSGSGDGR